MVTLIKILSNPFFHNFSIASGKSGLYNSVKSTGFFEWESDDDIVRSFREGEFVVTTLSIAKDNTEYAEKCLRLLISNQVAAIAIKDIYYSDISLELKQYSEECRVPILFFSETYIDDALYNVKNEILHNENVSTYCEEIDILISDQELKRHEIKALALQINPFFYNNAIICAYISFGADITTMDHTLVSFYENVLWNSNNFHVNINPSETVYAFVPYKRGIILIYTMNVENSLSVAMLESFLNSLFPTAGTLRIGLSNVHDNLEELPTALREAFFANTSCILNREFILDYDSIGYDQLLMPICHNPWVEKYYNNMHEKIGLLSDDRASELMVTLTSYVECNGDINLTSKLTFQHRNTIRYRLSKAKKILDMDDDTNFYLQIYSFIRLSNIHKYLDPILTND